MDDMLFQHIKSQIYPGAHYVTQKIYAANLGQSSGPIHLGKRFLPEERNVIGLQEAPQVQKVNRNGTLFSLPIFNST